jgi:hypothetical protein
MLPDPTWPESPAWRAFDAAATTDTQFADGVLQGVRVVEQTLVPTGAGKVNIPALDYTYFDPSTASYETISTEPITLTVSPDGSKTGVSSPEPALSQDQGHLVANQPELRPIKVVEQGLATSQKPLVERPVYWILWTVPLALLGVQTGWQRWQRNQVATADLRRRRQAAQKARRSLKDGNRNGQQADRAQYVLLGYIADKVNQPVHGLTQAGLRELLVGHGVPTSLASQVLAFISQCQAVQYAPSGGTQEQTDVYGDAARLIESLEDVL